MSVLQLMCHVFTGLTPECPGVIEEMLDFSSIQKVNRLCWVSFPVPVGHACHAEWDCCINKLSQTVLAVLNFLNRFQHVCVFLFPPDPLPHSCCQTLCSLGSRVFTHLSRNPLDFSPPHFDVHIWSSQKTSVTFATVLSQLLYIAQFTIFRKIYSRNLDSTSIEDNWRNITC